MSTKLLDFKATPRSMTGWSIRTVHKRRQTPTHKKQDMVEELNSTKSNHSTRVHRYDIRYIN